MMATQKARMKAAMISAHQPTNQVSKPSIAAAVAAVHKRCKQAGAKGAGVSLLHECTVEGVHDTLVTGVLVTS